jgi:integrase
LFRIFVLLHQLGHRARPRNFSERHIHSLMAYWTAAPEPLNIPPAIVTARRPTKPYSAAYIQQQLSFLRAYTEWLGKPGMILAAERYVDDKSLVTRTYSAKRDKSWVGNGVDSRDAIERVARIDKHVAVQLQLIMAFGLRRKEAVMFCPHDAEVPAHAMPANHPPGERYLSFLRIKRGTKGGRLRYTAVRTDAQRLALAEAEDLAYGKRGHVGRPGLSLKQSLDHFSNVVRQVGLTRSELGVTPHGLRHQFASDLYFDISGLKPPVQRGEMIADHEAMVDAYHQVARQLGHNRPQISNAYLGSPRMAKQAEPTAEGNPS